MASSDSTPLLVDIEESRQHRATSSSNIEHRESTTCCYEMRPRCVVSALVLLCLTIPLSRHAAFSSQQTIKVNALNGFPDECKRDCLSSLTALFTAAPKVELHTHLDGALQPETLCSLALSNNASAKLLNTTYLSASEPFGCRIGVKGDLRALTHPLIASATKCPLLLRPYVTSFRTSSLTAFLEPFTCISEFILLPGGIEAMGRTFVPQQASENVVYTEGQFAPQLLLKSCSPFSNCDAKSTDMITEIKHVIMQTIHGVVSASEANGVTVRILLDCFRNIKVSLCEQLLNIAIDMKESTAGSVSPNGMRYRYSDYIVGVNLAGDEINFPNEATHGGEESFAGLFERMRAKLKKVGLGFAPHSGEPTFPESATDCASAIDSMGALRVGHGYHCTENSLKEIAHHGLHIETCPASSMSTGAVADGWDDHPIRRMNSLNISLSLNTDDRAVIGTTMSDQLLLARTKLGFSLKDIVRATVNGAKGSFAPSSTKVDVCRRVSHWWEQKATIEGAAWIRSNMASVVEVKELKNYLESLHCDLGVTVGAH